nr:phospholipase-like protein [Tanacetum cinerariifolium]
VLNPKVRLTATPDETNQEWWKRRHEYFYESLLAYENVENSENERVKYAVLNKGVSSDAYAGESSGEKMALNVPQVKQELSYAADDLHTMALDEDAKDAKVCIYEEPKPSTTLHSYIPTDDVQSIPFDDDDAKLCIGEQPKPSTALHSFTPHYDTGAEYMNEELRNISHNKEPLSKKPYVPFCMHTRSRDYQHLDKQPGSDKLRVNNVCFKFYFKQFNVCTPIHDTTVVDETADKQVVDAKTIKMIKVEQEDREELLLGERKGKGSQVYFPLNEPNIHWSLAELHITSGVITFYDGLGPGKELEERDWWENLRKYLSLKIPTLMTLHGVFQKKDIDPEHYTITFKQAQNASRHGLYYGDYGVWVCILLYRLSFNISLEVRDLVHIALAYQEQLTAFLEAQACVQLMEGADNCISSFASSVYLGTVLCLVQLSLCNRCLVLK